MSNIPDNDIAHCTFAREVQHTYIKGESKRSAGGVGSGSSHPIEVGGVRCLEYNGFVNAAGLNSEGMAVANVSEVREEEGFDFPA